MATLTFLGSGGGRFMLITQIRGTGGFRIDTENFHIHVDPGPGALLHSIENKLNPEKINCIIVTHAHTDHCTDAAPLIEAMCGGILKQKGTLIVSKSIIEQQGNVGPVLSEFHYGQPKEFYTPKAGDMIELAEKGEKISLEITKCEHPDATTFGFKINLGNKILGYTSDTAYFEGMGELYKGCDILVINNTRPGKERIPGHLCTEDTIKLLKVAKPKMAILAHMGMKMFRSGISNEAQRIQRETSVQTRAAQDGMKIDIGESSTQANLKRF